MKTFRERVRGGEIVFGGTVAEYLRPSVVKAFAGAGFDFIFIEKEHVSIESERLADFVQCARDNNMPVVSKVGELNRGEAARLLDMGVLGIQLPRTETPGDMTTLYDYIKYPPLGSRASATGFGNTDYVKPDKHGYYDRTNDQTLLVCHIETMTGVENMDAILDIEGIDVCFVGSSDLSVSFGKPGAYTDPDFMAMVQSILDACGKRNIAPGIVGGDCDTTRYWIDQGVTFFECVADLDLVRSGAARAFEQLQKARDSA